MHVLVRLLSALSRQQMPGRALPTTRNRFLGHNGSRSCATVSVLEDSWLTKPKKDRRSLRFAEVGNFESASVMEGSMQ